MTITLDLPPELEARLTNEAKACGMELQEFVESFLEVFCSELGILMADLDTEAARRAWTKMKARRIA